jgi:bifunctional DNA-binding transcriptional regulator/antitoxin component of YhaV-PrlF toxin-antitoxin module
MIQSSDVVKVNAFGRLLIGKRHFKYLGIKPGCKLKLRYNQDGSLDLIVITKKKPAMALRSRGDPSLRASRRLPAWRVREAETYLAHLNGTGRKRPKSEKP